MNRCSHLARVAALLGCCAGLALAGQAPARANFRASHHLTVSVTGSYRATPDEAVLEFNAQGRQARLSDAYRQAESQTAMIRALLRRHHISDQAATFAQYTTEPVIDWKTQKLTGYRVEASIVVRLDDFRLIGAILADAARENLTALRSLNFVLRHPGAAKQKAIVDAYRKARGEAATLAAAAGERLGRLQQAQLDVNLFTPRPMMMQAQAAAPAPALPGNFQPRRIPVQARLTAVFALR